jgi:hypothetical protein
MFVGLKWHATGDNHGPLHLLVLFVLLFLKA